MASADLAGSGSPRLEEFVAFNDELAALVRSGLPLEAGLDSGPWLSGRIADRLRQGETLEAALDAEGKSVPPVYRAVIQAGLRSGKLADAVETVSRSARMILRLRRRLALASIYPALLIIVAFGLSAIVLPRMLSSVALITADMGRPLPGFVLKAIGLVRDNPTGWLWWFPILVLGLLWGTGGLSAITRRLPGMRGTLHAYRIAAFSEIAAGLLEQGVPLEESLTLAAGASGDDQLARDAAVAAEALRAGQPPAEAILAFRSLPRFPHWMITTGASQGTLPATFRHVADWAGRSGAARADWFSIVAPAVLTVLVGGLAVALFAIVALGPVVELLRRLAAEISR